MIELALATARVPPLALAPMTQRFDAGVYALLGGKGDGPSIALQLLAGRTKVRAGTVRVLGGRPDEAQIRRRVAYVPLDAPLPEPLRVDEVLRAAASIRGERGGRAELRLEALGIGALASRAVRSLSLAERRAVALAEAITSTAQVLLVEEPLAMIDPRAATMAAEALRARARSGACVLVATGSVRDAHALAGEVLTFERGAVVRRAGASDPLVLAGPRGAVVRVVASDTKRLVAALAGDQAVRDISFEAGVLVARGEDAVAIAAAIARAASRVSATIESLVPDVLHEEELRAAIAGDTAGAYRLAYERARGAGGPPEESPV